jgi:hypothetical protein
VRVRRPIGIGLLIVAGLLVPRAAAADVLCKWFGRCLYESPGFRFTVVDKETGRPLADVHALAEWIGYGALGHHGVFMAQDAVSGPDGVVPFPPWGPIRGSPSGLVFQFDPVITLFGPGYILPESYGSGKRWIYNATPGGITETTRVRRFGREGERFAMEPFRGTSEAWVRHLREVAFPDVGAGVSEEARRRVRRAFLNRHRRVQEELEKLPRDRRDVEDLRKALHRDLQFWRKEE